jgi:hypothetical protein
MHMQLMMVAHGLACSFLNLVLLLLLCYTALAAVVAASEQAKLVFRVWEP